MKEMDIEWDQLKAYWAESEEQYEVKSQQRLQHLLKGKEQSLIRTISLRIVLEIVLMVFLGVGLVVGTYLINSPYQYLERIGILAWGIMTIALYGRVWWFVRQPVDKKLSVKAQLSFVTERIREFLSVHRLMSSWILPIWVSLAMFYGLFLGLYRMNAGFPDIPIPAWGIIVGILLLYLLFSRVISLRYIDKLYQQPLNELEENLRELES